MRFIKVSFLLLITTSCFSQEYSDMWEMYKTSYDFIKSKSCYVADFTIKQDFQNNIFYNVSSSDSEAKQMAKQKTIWGIYKESDSLLFLNAQRMGMKKKYVKVREIGKYTHFVGEYVPSIIEQDKIMRSSTQFGAILGGILVAGQSYALIEEKGILPYIMNLEVGVPHVLDKYYLTFILQDFPDLLSQFKAETNPDDLETQLKYVRLLNKR